MTEGEGQGCHGCGVWAACPHTKVSDDIRWASGVGGVGCVARPISQGWRWSWGGGGNGRSMCGRCRCHPPVASMSPPIALAHSATTGCQHVTPAYSHLPYLTYFDDLDLTLHHPFPTHTPLRQGTDSLIPSRRIRPGCSCDLTVAHNAW